jgi:hypothetical protein
MVILCTMSQILNFKIYSSPNYHFVFISIMFWCHCIHWTGWMSCKSVLTPEIWHNFKKKFWTVIVNNSNNIKITNNFLGPFGLQRLLKFFVFPIVWLWADEGYHRNALFALNLIHTFLFKTLNTKRSRIYRSWHGTDTQMWRG